MIEVIFVSGPLLAGVLAATVGPAGGLVVAAVLGAGGAIVFQSLLAVEPGERSPTAERHWLGALRSPTLRALVLGGLPLGGAFGALDVVLPAFGAAHGASALGGPLTAALAAGSGIGGIAFGARPSDLRSAAAGDRQARRAADAHLPTAPLRDRGAGDVRLRDARRCLHRAADHRPQQPRPARLPAGTATEAFTWLALATTVGASAGAAVVGPLVEADGLAGRRPIAVAVSGIAGRCRCCCAADLLA